MFSSKFTDHDRTTEHSRSLRSLAALFNFLSLMLLELVFRALALQLRCPKNRNRFSFVRFKTALIKLKVVLHSQTKKPNKISLYEC